MAKNHVGPGGTVNFDAPTGGVTAGVPVALNDLVVIPLAGGPKGTPCVGFTGGVWNVQAAPGLKQGQKVNILAGVLVKPDTAESVPYGKMMSDESGGMAEALLIP